MAATFRRILIASIVVTVARAAIDAKGNDDVPRILVDALGSYVLTRRGLSPEILNEIASDGDVYQSTAKLNEAFGREILVIQDDALKVDANAFEEVVQDALGTEPILWLATKRFLDGEVRSKIEDFSVSLNAVGRRRSKRDIWTFPLGFLYDFYEMIVNAVRVEASKVVISIIRSIDEAFAGVISALANMYVETEPPDFFPALYAYTLDLVLERLVALVAIINVSIDEFLYIFVYDPYA